MSGRPCTVPGCPITTRRGSGRCPEHRYADRDVREPVPPPAGATSRAEAAESLLRNAFGDDVRIGTATFVSGAVAVVLRRGSDVAAMLGSSSGDGWRVSDEVAGRDAVVPTVDDAVEVLRGYWSDTAGRQSGHDR